MHFSQLFPIHLNTIMDLRPLPLVVRIWRLKSLPALWGLRVKRPLLISPERHLSDDGCFTFVQSSPDAHEYKQCTEAWEST